MELTKDKQEEKKETPDEEKYHSAKYSSDNHPGKEAIAFCGAKFKFRGITTMGLEEAKTNGVNCQDCLMVIASRHGRSL